MVVYLVVDNNNGLMFNKRRQSQDKLLIEDILCDCRGTSLWMNEYSEMQFVSHINHNIIVDDDFLDKASVNDACFVENNLLSSYIEKISKIVLYKWNRSYPADFYFDIDLADWQLLSSTEFSGNSHKNITKEVWIR